MVITNIEIGAYLAHLRDKAGLKQNELANRVTWSPAVLSRVESGDRALSLEERDSILDAIGTEEARSFKESFERPWQHLPRPPFGHPDEAILWEAEQALEKVIERAECPHIKNASAKRLETFRRELVEAASTVRDTEHNIAFVGNVGVGKTTALCRLAGLEVWRDGKHEPALAVGGGRTTVCEVRIMQGGGYGLFVEPMTIYELHQEVMEFAVFLTGGIAPEPTQEADEQDAQGTSKEIIRVIRNMSGLTVDRERQPDGKRRPIDRAKNLAGKLNDASALSGEIMAKMRLPQRTKRQLWYSEISGKEPLLWLKENFEQINKGLHPEFSMPKRIDITVPDEILGKEDLSICLVDTRGIDDAAERADLESHFRASGTAMVLCSDFKNAPEPELQQLLRAAADGEIPDIKTKAAILVLPHPGEALTAADEQGTPANSVEDGYELKGDDVEWKLASQKLPSAGTEFFNVYEDDPQKTVDFLLELVDGVRDRHRSKLREVINGATALINNFREEEDRAVYAQAARPIWRWMAKNHDIDGLAGPWEGNLIIGINQAHASSVRASIRRRGDWYNLDYSYRLGRAARLAAARAVAPRLDSFRSRIAIILEDEELQPTFDLIEQARRILEDGAETLYLRSELLGKRIYIQDLKPASELWNECGDQWGRGGGYRANVSQIHEKWFSVREQFQTMILELVNEEWTRILKRLTDILDPAAAEAVAA